MLKDGFKDVQRYLEPEGKGIRQKAGALAQNKCPKGPSNHKNPVFGDTDTAGNICWLLGAN